MYDPQMVQPMRDELVRAGFQELRTPADVDATLAKSTDTVLLVVNSVCGCAAGAARPGVRLAVANPHHPAKLVTVFAGQDVEATRKAREYLKGYPPSSPSMALLRDGQVLFMLERHQIEGRPPEAIAQTLGEAFAKHCLPDEGQA